MTMTQRRRGVHVTANPRQGVRVQRSTESALRQTGAGRIALPLSVSQNGAGIGDAELVMTCEAAAELYAELGQALADAGHPAARGETPCP
ncbi:hypothetical protein [Streptomyces cyaneofuscatus]|uniref:hypothetical protein n=1 Tax=Streptomyces cyaneofuscatus TaxID=66883 RepID=UPI0037F3C6B5